VTITPGANTITIASSAIATIDGDTGSATGSTVTIKAGVSTQNSGATVEFVASGSTLTFDVTDGVLIHYWCKRGK